MVSRSIICRSQRLGQITDLRDTDKSQYFAINEINNCYCFITWSPFFWSTKYVKSPSACLGNWSTIFTQERRFNYAYKQNIICIKTLICRQLFAGHMENSRPMKRKEKIHRTMLILVCLPQWDLKILPSLPCILYCKLNLWGIWVPPFEQLSPNLQHFRDLQNDIHIAIILQIFSITLLAAGGAK